MASYHFGRLTGGVRGACCRALLEKCFGALPLLLDTACEEAAAAKGRIAADVSEEGERAARRATAVAMAETGRIDCCIGGEKRMRISGGADV